MGLLALSMIEIILYFVSALEALDLLLVSLDQAPIDLEHIPVLLSVAESVLFRLSLDVAWEPYLYSTEVKFSKVTVLLKIFIKISCYMCILYNCILVVLY